MAFIYSLADTWNDGATTFTGIGLDVTDTASSSSSLLMDLQVGGASKFSVDKSGNIAFPQDGVTIYPESGSKLRLGNTSNKTSFEWQHLTGVRVAAGTYFAWDSSSNLGGLPNLAVALFADAANTLAQRNSTNAQTFNLYNTYTDGSNYERGFMKWNSNVLEIGTEAAGTGTARALHISGLPTSDPAISGLLWNDAGTVKVSAG